MSRGNEGGANGVLLVFRGTGRHARVAEGTNLLAAVRRAGLPLARSCGGRGVCDSCALRVDSGADLLELRPAVGGEARAKLASGWLLACLARVAPRRSAGQIVLWSPAWSEDPGSWRSDVTLDKPG